MLFRSGLILSCCAVLLQIAVYLQTLLPSQYQIAPICETITRALLLDQLSPPSNLSTHTHSSSVHQHAEYANTKQIEHDSIKSISSHFVAQATHHDHHDTSHQCQYCTVHANLVLPPELGIKEVLERIQIRLLFYKRHLLHVYFILQRLFLIPQGRAPPAFA